ncbi:MAG: methyltransferase domain-containing protein [Gammaproteobacteria bacterium]|nr:methyltransferase domain-containing protein [Gammaproteobacteria bacterium]
MARKAPKIVDVEIVDIAEDGFAEGTAEGRQVRVKGAFPGERVAARIIKRRKGTWWGIPETTAGRPATSCPAFRHCGGCTMQQLDVAAQLQHKQRVVLKALQRQGVEPERIAAPVHGPRLQYRRKARLGGRYLADKQEFLLGFRESFGSRVARLDTCPVLAEPFSTRFAELKKLLGTMPARADLPQLEIAAGDAGASLALRHLTALSQRDLQLLRAFERSSAIQVLLQSGGYDSLVRLDGAPERPLSYRLDEFGVCISFQISDFVQINEVVNQRLVAAALAALKPAPGERVMDLFCGLGNFTLPIARRGADVVGMEGSAQMVGRARVNAERNGVEHRARFLRADLYDQGDAAPKEPCGEPFGEPLDFDKVLVDPPRSGCGPALALATAPRVGRVVYVSCHPDSFAADAARMRARGFDLKRLGLFDMFPHTAHAETLAVFERR